MTRLLVFDPKRGFRADVPVERISELLKNKAIVLWLDLENPTPEERALLTDEFRFHPLAVEDTEHAHQRPKIESYEAFYFMVLYTVALSKPGEDGVQTADLAVFLGANYLVTVHHAPLPVLADAAAQWQAHARAMRPGVSTLLWALLDSVVDDYFPAVDIIGDRIDDLEDRIFETPDGEALQPLFGLKRDLLVMRRIFAPERDVVNTLMRRELPFIDPQAIVYFQDVYDHLARLTDSVDTFRDILTTAMDAHLSVVSNRLNQVMRTMTAIATILMSLGLVASIYGMNFRYMPETQWRYGYFGALGFMLVVGAGLVTYFRRIRWL